MKLKRISMIGTNNFSTKIIAENVYAIVHPTGIYFVPPSDWEAYRKEKLIENTDDNFFSYMSRDDVPNTTILVGSCFIIEDM